MLPAPCLSPCPHPEATTARGTSVTATGTASPFTGASPEDPTPLEEDDDDPLDPLLFTYNSSPDAATITL